MTKKHDDTQEKDLIRKVLEHDPYAMRLMYDRYAGYLMGVCTRYVSDGDDAKDILQDCFIKIFNSLSSFEWRGNGALKAWMTRIVINESLGFLRSRKLLTPLEYDDTIPDDDALEAEEPDVETLTADVIHEMISDLPAGYRTVFNLFVIEGKSHKEIAQLLGIAADSSASQLSRAKKILAKKINEYRETRKYE